MSTMASQITSASIVYSTVSSYVDQRKYQCSASLAFARGNHRWPVNFLEQMASNAEYVSIWWRRLHYDTPRQPPGKLASHSKFPNSNCTYLPLVKPSVMPQMLDRFRRRPNVADDIHRSLCYINYWYTINECLQFIWCQMRIADMTQ